MINSIHFKNSINKIRAAKIGALLSGRRVKLAQDNKVLERGRVSVSLFFFASIKIYIQFENNPVIKNNITYVDEITQVKLVRMLLIQVALFPKHLDDLYNNFLNIFHIKKILLPPVASDAMVHGVTLTSTMNNSY
jgi:hypothetical protein